MNRFVRTWWWGTYSLLILTAAGCSEILGGGVTNAPPVALAGPNQSVTVGSTVNLDGTGSADPDGDVLSYVWTFVSMPAGSAAVLTNPSTATPSFTADAGGDYELALEVSDGFLSDTDGVTIAASSVANASPVALAGPNQSVTVGSTVSLDGTGSTDPDGDVLSYAWTFTSMPAGSAAVLANPSTATPSFTADAGGDYELALEVSDGFLSDTDQVTISSSIPVAGSVIWTRQFNTHSRRDSLTDVAVDASGNVLVTGYTYGNLEGTKEGSANAYVRKYDSNGNVVWTRQFGPTAQRGQAVAVDGSGNVLVLGTTAIKGGLDDVFVRKYDANGNEVWHREFGTTEEEGPRGLAVDGSGSVLVAGYTRGNLEGSSAGLGDAFVRKYDANGNEVWTRQFGTASWDAASDVAVDGSGNVLVTGYTQGSLEGTNSGMTDAFVRKYDANGNEVWTRQFGFGANHRDFSEGVAVDGSGSVLIAGITMWQPDGALFESIHTFVRKYDATGNMVWSDRFGSGDRTSTTGVAVDGSGNVFIAGNTKGDLEGTKIGTYDAFVRKYDANGNIVWTRQFGTAAFDSAAGVAVDRWGYVLVAGNTGGSFEDANDFGRAAFVRKYAP